MGLIDPRITKQAEILVDHSVKAKKGERIAIVADIAATPLLTEVYKKLIQRGVSEVSVRLGYEELQEEYYKNASKEQLETFPKMEMQETKNLDCYIYLHAPQNTRHLSQIDSKLLSLRRKVRKPISDWRVEKTRWVISNFPTQALAQEGDMSLDEYSDFMFTAVNNNDWKKVYKQQESLRKLMDKTKKVRIAGKGTDLTLEITGRRAINCAGEFNMPDGEVFTGPLENKTEGFVEFSYPALYGGREFHDVRLEFKKGKVVRATASKNEEALNEILNTDPGARILGELGIGNNFKINKFTKDILFDEKIGGTVHLALGSGYTETKSRNKSAIHWDMIKDLRTGGELYFDGKLVQKNGKWRIKL